MELQKLIDGLKAHRNGAASYESVDEAIRVFEAMRDVDGEKVRKGLECCKRSRQTIKPRKCEECPYKDDSILNAYTVWQTCENKLAGDAIALIRQQQERIKKLEAANASWQTFAPFLHAHGLLNDMEGAQK